MGGDPRRKGYRASLTPEQILELQFRAKCRFKAAVRFVIANLYWLQDVEDEELGEDVQKNVKLLTRKFRKEKGLLTLSDKAILNQPVEYRTDKDKAYINTVIGGLKCFRRYPSHVKSQLAAITYFVYYGPGRTIVREGDEAHALYFTITGDVGISQQEWDPLLNKNITVQLGEMGPGGIFGEVSLLHNIRRTATITTLSKCFNIQLNCSKHIKLLSSRGVSSKTEEMATVQEQWNDIKRAMRKFTYFDEWDEMAIRDCCIMAKMRSYKTDDTILGDGYGLQGYTYFLLEGKCRMIEHVRVLTELINGIKRYKLYELPKSSSSLMAKDKSKSKVEIPSKLKVQESRVNFRNDSQPSLKEDSKNSVKGKSKSETIEESFKVLLDNASASIKKRASEGSHSSAEKTKRASENRSPKGSDKSVRDIIVTASQRDIKKGILKDSKIDIEGFKDSKGTIQGSKISIGGSKSKISSKVAVGSVKERDSNASEFYYKNILPTPVLSRSRSFDTAPEIIFLQVCLFSPTACFGIGENLKNRRIVAMTDAQCLLVPRYWLMQRNKGNVWNLVQHILNHLPTTKEIFKDYVNHKKWLQYRKTLIGDILAKSKIPCENNHSNIPYIIRMNEDINFP